MNLIKDITLNSNQANALKHKNKIGLGLNIAILAMIVLAFIAMFCGLHPSQYPINTPSATFIYPGVFSKPYTHYLSYFGLVMNIVAALCSIMNIVYFAFLMQGKRKFIPKCVHVINFILTVSLVFNFIFILIYMMPVVEGTKTYYFMYLVTGSNLLFNAFVPLTFAFQFIFCFKDHKLRYVENLYTLIPLVIYSIIYGSIALCHIQDGKIAEGYDLYLFGMKYFWLIFIAFIACVLVSHGLSVGINKLNQISKFNRIKFVLTINLFIAIVIPIMTGLMFYHNATVEYQIEGLTPWQTIGIRFTYFTHWSNWLTGIACVIQSVYLVKLINGKIKCLPTWVQVAKLGAIALITVTLVMQFIVSGSKMISNPNLQTGIDEAYKKCYNYHLIFEHFINPLLVLGSFILLENSKIKFKHLFFSSLPFGIYALIYAIVLYCHIGDKLLDSPKVTTWDVYRVSALFGKAGPYVYWILPAVAYVAIFGVNWILWLINRKIRFTHTKAESVFVEFKNWKKKK